MSEKSFGQKLNLILAVFLTVLGSFSLNLFAQTKLPASPIETVYITPTSHYDFGFIEPPEQVRERAARHIDEVINVAETNPNFRWTIESVWQVNEWIKRARKPSSVLPKDKEKIARLMRLIKSGQIALSTSWGSMHTDFMGAEELNRLIYDYENLRRTYGVNSELALMDDVPGHPTSIPNILQGSGTKYLAVGANLFIGDATSLAPGRVPFYWQSPDGSKVLTWVSQSRRGGYTEGMTDFYVDPFSVDPYTDRTPFDMFNPTLIGKKTPLEIQEIGMTELINRYNKANYKFDAVMVYYAHDFVEPNNVINLEKAVKIWNAKHSEIKMKIATPTEFFKYIESKYATQLETHSGEWSGLWSESKTQSPRISALTRYAHDHAPAAETLWSAISMTRRIPFPTGNFTTIYDLMFTYDEHSGAGNNGWIQLNDRGLLEEQNRQYVEMNSRAKRETDFLLDQGLNILAQPSRYEDFRSLSANSQKVLVYNGLSWMRSDVVKIKSPAENLRVVEIKDASNNRKIKFDIDEKGELIFIAENVPSFGYKTFEFITEKGISVSTLKEEAEKSEIKNDNFQIKFDKDGNIESIFDIRQNREVVNKNGALPFNELLRVEGQDASRVAYPIMPEILVRKGNQMSQIIVRRVRSVFPVTVLTIYDNLTRVELHNELSPDKMPFAGGNDNWNDSYYFAFPFNVSANNLEVKRGGQKWFDTLPKEYLLGARRDAVTTQHLFGFTDGSLSAMIAHRQAFHWVYPSYVSTKIRAKDAPKEFPAMFTGKFPLPEATIYSRAVRRSNQADTHDLGVVNMQTVEPGLQENYIFDYAIAGGGKFDETAAWQLGANFNLPLLADYVAVAPVEGEKSFFSINSSNVQIVAVKPIFASISHGEVGATPLNPQINKVFVIRLQEFAGKQTTAQISLPIKIKSASLLSLTEEKVLQNLSQISPLTVELKPFETKTVKIEIQ